MIDVDGPFKRNIYTPDLKINIGSDPLCPALFAPRINHLNTLTPASKKINEYQWTFLSILRELSIDLLRIITACFHWLLKQISTSDTQELHQESNQEEIEKLFNYPINYDRFREEILNYRKRSSLFYNNYNFKSYLQLKDDIINDKLEPIKAYSDEDQRDLAAGIANYEAIVDLYVQRFLDRHPHLDQEPYLPALQFIALCIAIKVAYDQPVWNSDFQSFLQIPLSVATHNKMELAFLKGIEWNISLTDICSESPPFADREEDEDCQVDSDILAR